LRFGTWIGGDLDGNPAAGPASIAEALQRGRRLALERYRAEVRALAVELASARSLVSVSAELEASLVHDEAELRASSGWSSCSASTLRRSTCGCTRATSTVHAHARLWRRRRKRAGGTGR